MSQKWSLSLGSSQVIDSLISSTCSKDFTFSTFLTVLKQNSLGKFQFEFWWNLGSLIGYPACCSKKWCGVASQKECLSHDKKREVKYKQSYLLQRLQMCITLKIHCIYILFTMHFTLQFVVYITVCFIPCVCFIPIFRRSLTCHFSSHARTSSFILVE